DWSSFYAQCRIIPLVKRLVDEGAISFKDMETAETLCNKLENIFPREPASLLHGDLWAGNYLVHSSGYAAIFDPAVYFGHREMDIGMTRLFGGFDHEFYNVYNQTYPLENGWEQRLPVAQLYPILVHAVLFGGHYCRQAMDIVKRFC
ncbi:MAG TPA: fructosamine kinase family protein, partial [Chitinophagaceae bacterium]|nr:fructosamine kinase family protein [Chitinophagaceae bacterium]